MMNSPSNRRGIVSWACAGAWLWASAAAAAQPAGLKAFFRSGQTFITWTECGAARYKVYRAAKRIADVAGAKLVATVREGSGTYPLEVKRKVLAGITKQQGYGCRYVIRDNPTGNPGAMLPPETGLFVHTPHQSGTFFYAVTAVGSDGKEDASLSPANSLQTGVPERQEPIGAVLVYQAPARDGKGGVVGTMRVYCHWMDAAEWNPEPYGGYALNFGVGIPKSKDPKGLVMFLHGYSGYYGVRGPAFGMVSLVPGDPYQTWFYGHKDATGKKVVNYTERRMMMTIDFVVRQLAAEGVRVNTNKIYIHGGSMGGTGGNFLGARCGNVLSAVLASKGAVDHNRNGNWTGDAERRLWGPRSKNLPTNEGTGVWDHQNLIKWHRAHVGVETAFFLDAHASNDGSVPFGAVPEYYDCLQETRRPFAAVWGPWGHGGFSEPRWPNHRWWGTFQFSRDESVPAIGYATSNDDPRKDRSGQINCKVEWSAREHDFSRNDTRDNLVDEPDRWECCIRSLVGRQTASITPRRCRKFKPDPGEACRWENHSYADPARPEKLAEGTVKADKHGLVTVEKFQFDKGGWGNRLIITKR